MSDTVPTIIVKGQDGQPLIKNLSDYDPKKHELYSASANVVETEIASASVGKPKKVKV